MKNSNQLLIEQGRFDLLCEIVEKDYEQYSGRVLEMYFRDKIARKLNGKALMTKSEVLEPNLDDYKIEYRLLSMKDL